MERFKFLTKNKIKRLPENPGVYAFKKGDEFLYIGKAANLKERVKNHFQQFTPHRIYSGAGPAYINQTSKIGYLKTESEIEALILEAHLIKKYKPKYNVVWQDDKNFFYIGITKDEFPRVFITHQPKPLISRISYLVSGKSKKAQNTKYQTQNTIFVGPFVDGKSLKQTLRFLRKIFSYYTVKKHPKKPCGHCYLGLCPGPNPDLKEHRKNIKNLVSVLKGKRKSVSKNLKGEMFLASSMQDFEKAAKIRDQIRALEKVFSHTHLSFATQNLGGYAKIFGLSKTKYAFFMPWQKKSVWAQTENELRKILKMEKKISRIEAYDISNIQGKMAAGSMVTFINGIPDKNFYRKFKIKYGGKSRTRAKLGAGLTPYRNEVSGTGPNDIAMIKEVLSRRFGHPEWPFPDVILIDGGKAQLNATILKAKSYLPASRLGSRPWQAGKLKAKVIALAKKKNELFVEGQKKPILLKTLPRPVFNLILQLRDEAHRFALTYHLKLRKKDLFK